MTDTTNDQPTGNTSDETTDRNRSAGAWGAGLATLSPDGQVLDTWFPRPHLGRSAGFERSGALDRHRAVEALGDAAGMAGRDDRRRVEVFAVVTVIDDLDEAPTTVFDAYLRLHLLSHRLIAPHGANLDGLFGVLANVVWTNHGPCAVDGFERTRARLRGAGGAGAGAAVNVLGVDKIPRMCDYVVPGGVRIADADRVRLGAHLAEGTTVMHEGFVNFNAGTLGTSMIEGRISSGVVVGDGSDIGGGASTMGTLSGGGREVIRVGRRCLIGANAGIGIALGDDCIVEAGLYVTAGARVVLDDGTVTKARELSGRDGVLFRRNSQSGAIEALLRTGSWGALNAELHAN